jgi:flavodoxin
MKSIILYYSYSGSTRKVAEKLARTQSAELLEIKTKKQKSKFAAYLVECPRARMRKCAAIQPVTQDLKGYDLITLAAPVWAGYPAPAFNSMVKLLPPNANVQVILVSASGSGATKKSEEGTRRQIKKQGCKVLAYKDTRKPA